MGKWTTEKMTEMLKSAIHDNLVGVILYGSAAAGDHAGKHSDYNLLVVTHRLSVLGLQEISKVVIPWVKQGNPTPLILTLDQLKGLVNAFPVEISDIRENHRMLYGLDPFPDLLPSHENFRWELEHELRGKVLKLKSRFVVTGGKPSVVLSLMIQSLSTFQVLFKNVLWLFNEKPPLKKMEALKKLQEHIPFDLEIFQILERLKRGEKIKSLNILQTFERYLEALESLIEKVNSI